MADKPLNVRLEAAVELEARLKDGRARASLEAMSKDEVIARALTAYGKMVALLVEVSELTP